jgi:hypothetical protein
MNKEKRERLVGNHTFCLGEDNILYITIVGNTDEEKIDILFEKITKLLSMGKEKVNLLVNIDKAEKPSIKARKLISTFISNKKVGKVAHFGLTPVAKVIASFFMENNKKKSIKIFNTKEKAISWLKG